jgi:hypothetical protein
MGDGNLDGYPIIQDQTSPNLAHIPTTNLLTYSEDFSQWNKDISGTGTTPVVTLNYAISPSGEQNASRIQLDIGGGTTSNDFSQVSDSITISNLTKYSRSIYVKSNTGSNQNIVIQVNGEPITTSTITTEWQRFETSVTSDSTSGFFRIRIRGNEGTVSQADILVWGAQLEEQNQATAYLKSDGIPAVRKSSTTNLIPYSEDFSQWTTLGATTISATDLTSPIGTTNATRITGLTGSGGNDLRSFPSNFDSANKDLTFSVYLKGSGTLRLQMSNGVDQGIQKIVTLTSDWKRHQVFGDFNSTSSGSQFHCNIDDYTATVTTYDVWGAQLEEQTQAETYAKTTGLPVTIDLFTENNYGTMTNMSASDIVIDTPGVS